MAELPFVCRHRDPRCDEDPCPAGIAWLCNAPADHPARAETFTCEACGSGPWHISWDPPEQPIMGGRGGRFCPNCSGAD